MAVATEEHIEHSKEDNRIGLPGAMPRKLNVTMIGAGSLFTNSILKDVVLIPGSLGGELRLIDIDPVRLELSRKLMSKVLETTGEGEKWTLKASTDRKELLPGTDYIVNSIEVSGIECVRFDNDIPLEYGVSQNIGDTIGPGGLFKSLRTIPVWLEILKDAERMCPNALVLNYTNPMNMMCLAAADEAAHGSRRSMPLAFKARHICSPSTPTFPTSRCSGNAPGSTTWLGSPS